MYKFPPENGPKACTITNEGLPQINLILSFYTCKLHCAIGISKDNLHILILLELKGWLLRYSLNKFWPYKMDCLPVLRKN